jgi:phosphoribosylanthranilate isomerase
MTALIKICGITSVPDAQAAIAAGANFIGLILAENSPRTVSLAQAAEICSATAGCVKLVGVFQNQPASYVNAAASKLRLDYVQLHGQEERSFCQSIDFAVIKTFELVDKFLFDEINSFSSVVKAVLLDRHKGNQSDTWLNWSLAAAEHYRHNLPPLIFAGGLNANTVKEVTKRLKPWAVDVASGVEQSPGIKDRIKMQQFCKSVIEEGSCSYQENLEPSAVSMCRSY